MYFANDSLQFRNQITAEPEKKGFCPDCDQGLVPRCGSINIWHWAHRSVNGCDVWGEGETDWHLGWKQAIANLDKSRVEVKVGSHRADVVANDGTVIELQHSTIKPEIIEERENYYQRLVWVLDCRGFDDNNFEYWDKGDYLTFHWKHPRRSFGHTKAPLILDFSPNKLFYIGKLHTRQEEFIAMGHGVYVSLDKLSTEQYTRLIEQGRGRIYGGGNQWRGWGKLIPRDEFITMINRSTNFVQSLKYYK